MSPSILNPSPFNPENSLGRILITGGCGFIGLNFVRTLIKDKLAKTVCILDNLSIGKKENLEAALSEFGKFNVMEREGKIKYNLTVNLSSFNSDLLSNPESLTLNPIQIELIIGDIRNKEICIKATKDIDIVIHLAANTGVAPSVENPQIDMETNVIGTFNMLHAARENGVHKFIFASSGAPLGEVEPPIHEKIAPKPVSPYGASKLAGEGYCSAYYRTFGIKTVVLRFGNVYGPKSKNKSSVVAKFFKQALNGETLEIFGDGNQTRDFIFIDDLINAIILAINPLPLNPSILNPEPWGEVFQIATYKETTVNEIAEAIKKMVKRETGKEVKISNVKPRLGDVQRNYSDISKAKKILGYKPRYSLEAGLVHTFEYFREKI